MTGDVAALGAAAMTVGVGAVIIGRAWPRPSGRHRRPHPSVDPSLLRPVEALDQLEAHCPVQDRPTLQLRLATGGLCCTECRHTTQTTTEDTP